MLKLENVITHYGDVQALQKVSFKVEEGQIVSIIGSNGSGKSTTLNTISGVLACSSGTIIFHDQRINQTPPHQIVEAGIVQVPEGRRLFPYMTVYENLKLGSFNSRGRTALRESIQEAYQYFPILAERRNQMAGTLSGGEQQMLAIGRGLMAKPKLLMLDEPSLGLAPLVVEQVFETVKKINLQKITILLVEQDVFEALALADWAYVLENGSISMEGGAEELLNNPQVKEAYLGI
ncbi:MAG: ABC transporter ATP-binding protein [Thermodesulfobacteriota bacterium]